MNYNGLTPEEVLAIATKKISGLKSIVSYKGVTTTALTDGSTTNPIIIEGSSYTATNGDCVLYEGVYYTWNGTLWQESLSFAEVITALENLNDRVDDTEDALDTKVDKVDGKGLSTNDYTDEDKAIVDGVTDALAEKADTDDIPDLVSDNLAKGILGNETVLSTDTVPFVSKVMSDGKYQRKKFVGCSYVWNQRWKVYETSSGEINGITYSMSRENGSITISGTATAQTDLFINTFVFLGGIVYLMRGGYNENIWIYNSYSSVPHSKAKEKIFKLNSNLPAISYYLRIEKDTVIPTPITLYPQIVNLTQLFGSTAIADYIYNLETATAGAGIAKLKELGFFTEDYYAYDAGSIQSVDIKEYSVTGKNLFDKNTASVGYKLLDNGNIQANQNFTASDYINVIPDSQLYLSNVSGNQVAITCAEYDSQKRFIRYVSVSGSTKVSGRIAVSSNTYYIRVNIGIANSDICQIELGSTATAYEPYHKTTYPLTPTELRGVPRIDANNNIYADGDEYASDGGHTEKYDIVDLGTLNWGVDSNYPTTFYAKIADIKVLSMNVLPHLLISTNKYTLVGSRMLLQFQNLQYSQGASDNYVYIRDDSYADVATFKTAMSGVYLVYEKDIPTTETLTPFNYPQSVGSLEEIVDYKVEQEDRDVAIPTGHVTEYMGKGGEFTLPTLPETPSVLAFDGHNFFWKPETT